MVGETAIERRLCRVRPRYFRPRQGGWRALGGPGLPGDRLIIPSRSVSQMKLYNSNLSPNALRTRAKYVFELGLDPGNHQHRYLPRGESRTPEYRKLNPNGKVPTLVGMARNYSSCKVACDQRLSRWRCIPSMGFIRPIWCSGRRSTSGRTGEAIHHSARRCSGLPSRRVQKKLFGRGEPGEAPSPARRSEDGRRAAGHSRCLRWPASSGSPVG